MIVRSVSRQSTAYVCCRSGSSAEHASALNEQSAPALTALQHSCVTVQSSHVAGGIPPEPAVPPVVELPPDEVVPPLVELPPDEVVPPLVEAPPDDVEPPALGGWWRKRQPRSASAVA